MTRMSSRRPLLRSKIRWSENPLSVSLTNLASAFLAPCTSQFQLEMICCLLSDIDYRQLISV